MQLFPEVIQIAVANTLHIKFEAALADTEPFRQLFGCDPPGQVAENQRLGLFYDSDLRSGKVGVWFTFGRHIHQLAQQTNSEKPQRTNFQIFLTGPCLFYKGGDQL